jgi:hypothetical protein
VVGGKFAAESVTATTSARWATRLAKTAIAVIEPTTTPRARWWVATTQATVGDLLRREQARLRHVVVVVRLSVIPPPATDSPRPPQSASALNLPRETSVAAAAVPDVHLMCGRGGRGCPGAFEVSDPALSGPFASLRVQKR